MSALLFDVKYDQCDGVYTLISTFSPDEYYFDSVLEAKAFIDAFYSNPVAAMFGYKGR